MFEHACTLSFPGLLGLASGLWVKARTSNLWAGAVDRGWAVGPMGLKREGLIRALAGPPGVPAARSSSSCQASPWAQPSSVCKPPAQPLSHTIHASPLQWQRACAAQRLAQTPLQALCTKSNRPSPTSAPGQPPCCVPTSPQTPAISGGLDMGLPLCAWWHACSSIRAARPPAPHLP